MEYRERQMLPIAQIMKETILDIPQIVKRNISVLVKLLPILSFIIPVIILYYLYASSFEETWKGRTYYLFFIWLVFLETILSWEELKTNKINKLRSIRTMGFIISLLLPAVYVLAANFLGLNSVISHLYMQHMGPGYEWWAYFIPLAIEYLVFAAMFTIIGVITYGKKGLTDFSISASLLFAIGVIYIMDDLYPNGSFTPFQILVQPTAALAANFLNLIGYRTRFLSPVLPGVPRLEAKNSVGVSTYFDIGWPCAGIESLLLYTITILLFLKKSHIPLKQMAIYFIFGAIVTYFINILRIATIFVIDINAGGGYQIPTQRFHEYYGQLYSIIWIISYPLIIIGSRALWRKIKSRKTV